MGRWLARIALVVPACMGVADCMGAAEAALKGSLTYAPPPFDRVVIVGPDSSLRVALYVVDGRIHYDINRNRTPIVDSSRVDILVDGVGLGDGVSFGAVDDYRVGERANGARVTITHRASGVRYGIDLRAYRDGAAFRAIVPGTRVADAPSSLRLPAGSVVLSEKRAAGTLQAKLPHDGGFVAAMESAPWRIIIVARDLAGLANSEIERDLAAPTRFLPF
jgi:hypothetical protein